MPLESGTLIPDLDANNPLGSDPKSEGDDHLRLVKRCVQGSFPAFVGTTAVPKSVTLTEEQINDAALKSEAGTISGAWRFNTSPLLANNVALLGRNAADDTSFELVKINTSNQPVFGSTAAALGSPQFLAQAGFSHQFFNGATEVARFSSLAIGSILVTDQLGIFKKAGFRNPSFNQENVDYTLQQQDEGQIVRTSSGASVTYTVPILEALTTMTIMNDDVNSTITLLPDGGVTMEALVGGAFISGTVVMAQSSVCQIWWVTSTLVRVWGNGLS